MRKDVPAIDDHTFPPRAMEHIDLAYLERLFKGDRARMEHWARIYLEDAPSLIKRLEDRLHADDAQGLAAVAHDLRPLAHYLGTERLLELLIMLGQEARSSGTSACATTVAQVIALEVAIEAELRAVFGIT